MSRPTAQRSAFWLAQEQTTFVGRVAELARLDAMLTTSRLATVTGTGGVGKTRLALRAAAAAEPRFADGARFAGLSGLRDPELLPNTVAAALGLPEHDPRASLDQVLDYLRDRELLLVLDTCEHLVDACALFAEAVLERTARVTILATSREPLSVAGEHEYPLAPLTVAGPGGSDDRDSGRGDAVELFEQRAAAVIPGFRASGADRAVIARLCRHLDGIPLAIELAAVQLREMPLGELARRVEHRLLDLAAAGGGPDIAGRHQTLRGAIGWSHELCTPEERLLWQRLSVFAGPADADAVRQVCAGAGLSPGTVTGTLIGLVDKSVVTRVEGGVSRYRMLDTLREYGSEGLAASGARAQVRARHLRRYLALASDLAGRPFERQVPKYQALLAQHDEIRTALAHAVSLDAVPGPGGHPALRLAADLEWYWVISARLDEGRYWLTKGIDRTPERVPRAGALITRGYLTVYQGDRASALADIVDAIAIADGAGDRPLRIRGLVYRAYIHLAESRIDEVGRTVAEARRLLGPAHDALPLALAALLAIVDSYHRMLSGDAEGCLRLCRDMLRRIPADSGERWASAYLHGLTGLSLSVLGRPDEGNAAVRHGIAMKRELGDKTGLAHGLSAAALVSAAQQRHERTAWLIGAAEPLWKQIGPTFVGVDIMQCLNEQAAQEARAALGDERYENVVRAAAACQVDQIVELAIRDADRLPALPPAGP